MRVGTKDVSLPLGVCDLAQHSEASGPERSAEHLVHPQSDAMDTSLSHGI